MTPNDYPDMGAFDGRTDMELEQILSGDGDMTAEDRHLSEVLLLTKRAVAPPDNVARRVHLAAMFEASSELRSAPSNPLPPQTHPTRRRPVRRGRSIVLKLATVALGLSLTLVGGMAFAEIDLTGTVAERIEAVLDAERRREVPAPSSRPAGEEGPDEAHPIIDGTGSDAIQPERSGAAGQEKARGGRARASDASEGRSDLGSEVAGTHNDAGRGRADQASEGGGANNGSDNAAAGADNAGTHDDEGRSTAEEKSAKGRGNGESKSQEGKTHKPGDPGKP